MTENILYGKRVVLFDFTPADLDHFVELHRKDISGFMQEMCLKNMTEEEAKKYVTALLVTSQIKIWSVYTKEGKNSRRAGFIYLTSMTSFSCMVSGIMDMEFARGITKKIRQGKYTFSEDALRTIVGYCFNGANYRRLETSVVATNKRALALTKKTGFIQEGISREALRLDDDRFLDLVKFAILKREYKNG